jgi:hypothetical protein
VHRLVAAALVILATSHALAQQQPEQQPQQQGPDPEQLLQMAERAYEQLEYEQALNILIQVHQVPGVTPMQQARSFLYMGVCFTALGNAENAVLSFMKLLKIKPNFRLPPGISPSIKAMFKEALFRLKLPETPPPEPPPGQGGPGGRPEQIPVKLEAETPKEVTAGKPVQVRIKITDPRKLVQGVLIRWRRVGGPDFSTVKVPYKPGTPEVDAQIPGATLGEKEGRLQYLVEAVGRGGMTLAHVGSLDDPRIVELTERKKPKTRWGWWALGIGGGLAVAGGVVAAILLTRGGTDNGTPPNSAEVVVSMH